MFNNVFTWLRSDRPAAASLPISPHFASLPDDIYNIVIDRVFYMSEPEDQLAFLMVCKEWNERGHQAKLTLRPKSFLPVALKSSFPNIEGLDLSSLQSFRDDMLVCLAALNSLTFLKLKRCRALTDDGLKHLNGLQALLSLNLARCINITKNGLLELCENLKNLRSLNVKYCHKLTSEGFAELSQLASLKTLNCTGCSGLAPDALTFIGQVSTLEVLKMNNCGFLLMRGIQEICQLPSLRRLQMKTHANLVDGMDSSLSLLVEAFPDLLRLDIRVEASSQRDLVNAFEAFEKIKTLNLTGNRLMENGILDQLTSLRHLSNFSMSDSSLSSSLSKLTRLRSLSLSIEGATNQEADNQHIWEVSTLTGLRQLCLSGTTYLTGDIVAELTGLRTLKLIKCPRLRSDTLNGFHRLRTLEVLTIGSCENLGDECWSALKQNENLRELYISECPKLTGSNISLLSTLTKLSTFVIQFCTGMTDTLFKQLLSVRSLRRLEIVLCQNLTEQGPRVLANEQLSRLEYLVCSGHQFTAVDELLFKKRIPGFKKLSTGFVNVRVQ